ncbi:SMP-30/gluconolactonase/LRE family protein [Microbacterium sp. AK031]|uniref:SMP-30/gluconolactonase/LRE family protein n=1 Tax=Microbacterium sp. AK031 TaxID=2723076 RepID=UPI0037C87950
MVYSSDREVCATLPADDGGTLIIEADRFVHLDPSGAVVDSRHCPLRANRRFNDATIDPQGRLVVGTLTRDGDTGVEELFRLEADGRLRLFRSGISLSNGITLG